MQIFTDLSNDSITRLFLVPHRLRQKSDGANYRAVKAESHKDDHGDYQNRGSRSRDASEINNLHEYQDDYERWL